MILISQRAYAKHAGVTHPTVRHWIARGMPTVGAKQQVVQEAADAWRVANTGAVLNVVECSARSAEVQPSLLDIRHPAMSTAADEPAAQPVGRPNELTLARTEREQVRVERERIRLKQEANEFVPADEMDARWTALVGAFRDALMNLPPKTAGRVKHARNEEECLSILVAACLEVMGTLEKRLREMAAA